MVGGWGVMTFSWRSFTNRRKSKNLDVVRDISIGVVRDIIYIIVRDIISDFNEHLPEGLSNILQTVSARPFGWTRAIRVT